MTFPRGEVGDLQDAEGCGVMVYGGAGVCDSLQVKAVRDDMDAVFGQERLPFFCNKRRNGNDMQLRETVGYESREEKRKGDVAVVEEKGEVAVFGEEQCGADAVRMDKGGGEIRGGLVEKREEMTSVLIILKKSFDACRPMSCGEQLMREGGGLGTRDDSVRGMIGGKKKRLAVGMGKS